MEKSLYNLIGAHIGDLSQIRFIDGIDDEYMADVDDDSLRAELDSDSDNDGLLDGITCNNPSNQTFYCSYASEDTKSDYGMIVGANASAAYL